MAQVKQDPDRSYIKQENIKQDPDSKDTVLADIDEEDLYEDAGDLDFTSAGQSVWLSRLPRQLWEHWAHLDDDEEIEIGTMRVEGTPDDIKRVSGIVRICRFSDSVLRNFFRSACAYTIALITGTSRKTTHSKSKRSILRVQDRIILIIPTFSPKRISLALRIVWPRSAKHDRSYTSHRNAKRRGENRARDGSLMCERRYPVCQFACNSWAHSLTKSRTHCASRCGQRRVQLPPR
jgi:hypothetical protein